MAMAALYCGVVDQRGPNERRGYKTNHITSSKANTHSQPSTMHFKILAIATLASVAHAEWAYIPSDFASSITGIKNDKQVRQI